MRCSRELLLVRAAVRRVRSPSRFVSMMDGFVSLRASSRKGLLRNTAWRERVRVGRGQTWDFLGLRSGPLAPPALGADLQSGEER
jgi:hypothetical protein